MGLKPDKSKRALPSQTEQNKAKLLKVLRKNQGLVSTACDEVGVSVEFYYYHYNKDLEFKAQVDIINEKVIDFAESKLYEKIAEGSENSIHFILRYRGRKRGYSNSIDITSDGKNITEIRLIPIKPKRDEDGLLTED
jgi:hypothetical protein